jgi:hypothetical protein
MDANGREWSHAAARPPGIAAVPSIMRPRALAAVLLIASSGCAGVSLRSPIATPSSGGPPSTFITTTADSRMTRVIDLRDGLTRAQAFHAASDYLTQKYSVDVSDSRAGFLMTPWQNSLVRGGSPDLRYRTRLIIRIGEDGKQASIRNEANWQKGDEWDVGFDNQMLEDAVVELRTRIGKKT